MAETETTSQTQGQPSAAAAKPQAKPGLPDPSISIIEFGDALGLLLAERTERDVEHRRLVLKKAAYIRLSHEGTGVAGYPEIWIEQDAAGTFMAVEPASGKIIRRPSKRRYELALVTFCQREGFSVEAGGLLAPDDYAAERNLPPGKEWLPYPPIVVPK